MRDIIIVRTSITGVVASRRKGRDMRGKRVVLPWLRIIMATRMITGRSAITSTKTMRKRRRVITTSIANTLTKYILEFQSVIRNNTIITRMLTSKAPPSLKPRLLK